MGNRGAIMPIILMLCFLLSGLIFFQIKVFINEKQNTIHEEQVLRLEWLLRNAEQKWIEHKEKEGNSEGVFHFPDGHVQYKSTLESTDVSHIIFTATDKTGKERTHSFYVEDVQDIEE